MDFIKPVEFGCQFSFPENMEINFDGLQMRVTDRICVQMAENYDAEVAETIAKAARDAGVYQCAVLNKPAIINALKKQIPQQVIMNEIQMLCPSCHYDMMGLSGCSRPQLLPNLRTEIEMEDE